MAQYSTTYDFSRFEERTPQVKQQEKAVQLKVYEQSRAAQARNNGKKVAVRMVLCMGLVALLLSLNVYYMALSNELTHQISDQRDELEELQGEALRLETELEGKTSLSAVGDYASEYLGLNKLDESQIQYVNLSNEDHIEVLTEERSTFSLGKVVDQLKSFFGQIKSYFTGQ